MKKSMKNGNHEKEDHPNDPRKTKFHDRAPSCGNHTFSPYDCPAILQRGRSLIVEKIFFGNFLPFALSGGGGM